jgi:hypothetical protein
MPLLLQSRPFLPMANCKQSSLRQLGRSCRVAASLSPYTIRDAFKILRTFAESIMEGASGITREPHSIRHSSYLLLGSS